MNREGITDKQRSRLAMVYIRQSSAQQVVHHGESQRCQRSFVRRAMELGWPAHRIRVIDEDLGKSGSRSGERIGFEQMVAMAALEKLGIILALEVSRLAQSNRDWYHLLDICSICGTLLADEEGLYNPALYNDRLLLGLKGTMSEADLHMIKQRLVQAKRAKAGRVGVGVQPEWEALPQINLGILYAELTSLPLFYTQYPGSIPDVRTLQNAVEMLEWLELSKAQELIQKHKRDLGLHSNAFRLNQQILYCVGDRVQIGQKRYPCYVFPTRNCGPKNEDGKAIVKRSEKGIIDRLKRMGTMILLSNRAMDGKEMQWRNYQLKNPANSVESCLWR